MQSLVIKKRLLDSKKKEEKSEDFICWSIRKRETFTRQFKSLLFVILKKNNPPGSESEMKKKKCLKIDNIKKQVEND